MPVIQAKSAGFCYGVRRAVELAEKTARENGGCVMLGSIIHNTNVVARLEQLGQVDSPDEVRPGDTVIIRSHGETRQVLERLEAMGARCVNATCPNVLHIQHIVSRAGQAGRIPLVIGEPHHPEVMGAASWWDGTLVFPGPEGLERWLLEDPARRDLPLTAVAQTTCVRSIWESSKKILKKLCTNAELFDTICDATHRRQSEAAEIASRVDVMVVVGDRKSANTKHLTEICRELCPRVYQIEGAEELTPDLFIGCSLAGLTAGASTPAGIIKEVYTTMSEEIKNNEIKEESFEELLDKSFKTLNTGDKVTGVVTHIGATEVQVDLGTKHAGYIPYDEVSTDPAIKPEEVLKVGDEIEVFVVRVNDQEGTCQLSKKKLDGLKDGDVLVLSGSIPSMISHHIYEEIMKRLEDRGVRMVVDAEKDLLLDVLPLKPFLIKPNNHELGQMFGRKLKTEDEIIECAKELQDRGAVNVLVSMAGDGALLVAEDGHIYKEGVCRGTVKNSVGAGDSMVAGFLAGYLEKGDYEYALKLGTASGGATAFSYGIGTKELIMELLGQLQ